MVGESKTKDRDKKTKSEMNEVPPLLFSGMSHRQKHAYAPVAGGARMMQGQSGGPLSWKGGTRPPTYRGFRIGLCGCCGAQQTGLDCFCAHCCCSVCIWSSAYKYAGIPGTERVVQQRVIAGALQGAADAQKEQGFMGGGALLQAGSDVANIMASFGAAKFRDLLYERLFGRGNSNSLIAHLCCTQCATVQEVDAVQELAAGFDVDLTYGKCSECDCYSLHGRLSSGAPITMAPLDNNRQMFKMTMQGEFVQDAAFKARKTLADLAPVPAVPAGMVVQGVPVGRV